jgi:signal transduction histidine kinase
MISLKLYRTLFWFAGLMGITSFALIWSIYVMQSWLLGAALLVVLLLIIYAVTYYLNATNRKIAFFFEAVENDDTALVFNEAAHSPVLTALHQGLNKLNSAVQRVKIEQRTREQYYQKIFDQINTCILTQDDRGFIYQANRACKEMLNRTHFTHIRQLAVSHPKLYHLLKNIQPDDRQVVDLADQETAQPFLLHAIGFKNQGRDLTIITMQNIRNELDYRELDSWMKLISVLTHEISNTVSPITSLSSSIHERFAAQNTAADRIEISRGTYQKTLEGLEVIKERGEGLIRFVNACRRLSKLPKPEKKRLPVEELTNKIKVLVSGEPYFDQVIFRQEIVPPELTIFADEKLLTQALINLLTNAIEALQGRPDGLILVTAEQEPNGKVRITVQDNGPGIPPELVNDIFTPFFTTRAAGSGIGLPLSRQILRLHGGTLTVKTVPGKGTAFTMVL